MPTILTLLRKVHGMFGMLSGKGALKIFGIFTLALSVILVAAGINPLKAATVSVKKDFSQKGDKTQEQANTAAKPKKSKAQQKTHKEFKKLDSIVIGNTKYGMNWVDDNLSNYRIKTSNEQNAGSKNRAGKKNLVLYDVTSFLNKHEIPVVDHNRIEEHIKRAEKPFVVLAYIPDEYVKKSNITGNIYSMTAAMELFLIKQKFKSGIDVYAMPVYYNGKERNENDKFLRMQVGRFLFSHREIPEANKQIKFFKTITGSMVWWNIYRPSMLVYGFFDLLKGETKDHNNHKIKVIDVLPGGPDRDEFYDDPYKVISLVGSNLGLSVNKEGKTYRSFNTFHYIDISKQIKNKH